jgi:hypothetical protein
MLLMSSIASQSSTGHTSRALNNDRGDRGDRRDNRRGRGDYRGASLGVIPDPRQQQKPIGWRTIMKNH